MKPLTCCVLAFVLPALSALAQAETPFDAAARAKAIAPFVEEETVAIAHLDLARLTPEAVGGMLDMVARIAPVAPSELDQAKKKWAKLHDMFLRAGLKDFYAVITLDGEDVLPQMCFVAPVPSDVDEMALRTTLGISDDEGQIIEGAFVSRPIRIPGRHVEKPREFRPVERPELAAAFRAAGDTAAQVILVPPRDARRVIEELMPQFPKELGSGSSLVLTRGIAWAAVGIDLSPHEAIRVTIQSPDAQAAEALRAKLADLLRLAGQCDEVRKVVPKFDEAAAVLAPKVEGDQLILVLDKENQGVDKLLAAVAPPVELMRAKSARMRSMNNLKQIALAMHNYYARNKHFPLPASRGPDGKPLLSWRVYILPYLGQDALFKQFHLDEPWDSPHNRTLIDKMPAVYRLPISKTEPGRTNYLLPVGNGALFDADKPTEFKDVTDGTSNTIMVVEVDDDHATVWTKPDDWPFDPKDPSKGLGRFFDDSFSAAICDGSAHVIKLSMDPKNLSALFTRAGGEVAEW